MRFFIQLTALIITMSYFSAPAFAQDDEDREIQYKEKTEIDFEGLDVNGELMKPQGILQLERRQGNFNPLIKLREDFNPEMDQSLNYIK
jgi:hypothetical protein